MWYLAISALFVAFYAAYWCKDNEKRINELERKRNG